VPTANEKYTFNNLSQLEISHTINLRRIMQISGI